MNFGAFYKNKKTVKIFKKKVEIKKTVVYN